jgi:Flp pilus assembly pilin Flp
VRKNIARKGQALSEYAVIVFLVLVTAIAALGLFGNQISTTISRITSSIS